MNNTATQTSGKMSVLFLCTGNSCRSQMAEGWARHLKSDRIDAHSAGVNPDGLNPLAMQVMDEAGVDISQQRSQHIDEFADVPLDLVISVCDHARESCPVFANHVRHIHVGFEDPPQLAARAASEEEALTHYRRVRDQIRDFVAAMPDNVT